MAESAEAVLSFSAGEDHVSHETRIPEGFARRVVNWDLDDTGVAHQRPSLDAFSGASDCHSVWRNPVTGETLAVYGERLSRLSGSTLLPVQTLLGQDVWLYDGRRVYYFARNGVTYFTNGVAHGTLRPDGFVHTWGVPNPVTPVRDTSQGIVRYLTYEDTNGQESGAVRFDAGVPPQRVGLVPRLFWSDGETTKYRLNGTGRELRTQSLVQFPPGRFLEEIGGRLATVRGSKVYYTSPLNYGLIDPRYNFIDAGSQITAMITVEDGTYVSTKHELLFYSGTDVDELRRESVLGKGILPGAVCRVPVTALSPEVRTNEGQRYAVAALTEDGIALLMNRGNVIAPTGGRLKLPPNTEVRMDLVERDGYYQVVAVPTQPISAASMAAIDSPVEPIEV